MSFEECISQDTLNNTSNYLVLPKNEIGFGFNYIDNNDVFIEYRRLIKEKEDSILLPSNLYERKTFMIRFSGTHRLRLSTAFLGNIELLGLSDSLAMYRFSGTHYSERMLHIGRENSYYLLHQSDALSGFNTFFNYFGGLTHQKRTDQYIGIVKQAGEELGPYTFNSDSLLNGNYKTHYLLAGLGLKIGLNMVLYGTKKTVPVKKVGINSISIGGYFGMTLNAGLKIAENKIIDEHHIFTSRNDFTFLGTTHLGIRVAVLF